MKPQVDPKVIQVGGMAVSILKACDQGSHLEPKGISRLVETTADALGKGAKFLFASLRRGVDSSGFNLEPELAEAIKYGVGNWLGVPRNWALVATEDDETLYTGYKSWATAPATVRDRVAHAI